MAKRRKISTPSSEELAQIETEFRGETVKRPNAALAPISHVAAEAAKTGEPSPAQDRAVQEKDRTDAQTLRDAEGQGRVIRQIPLDQILADAMVRDRTVIDPNDMAELKASIAAHGMRLPIEVFERDDPDKPYGLLSGYRRLWAVRELGALTEHEKYATINALVRDPDKLGGSFAAMVEENEIRASLSHYERGRIAVVAAQQGAFASTEDAVSQLFSAASKAKRSKIRSFCYIFEELGDILQFPENLKERDGLRLSNVLRSGAENQLRDALDRAQPSTPAEEWAAMEAVITRAESDMQPGAQGGRPKKSTLKKLGWQGADTLHLSSGITLQHARDSQGHVIRIKGADLDQVLVEALMNRLQYLLEEG